MKANAEVDTAYQAWRDAVNKAADAVNRQRVAGDILYGAESPQQAQAIVPNVRNTMDQRSADAGAVAAGQRKRGREDEEPPSGLEKGR